MGTSGAYGGSPGWNDTRQDTDAWLDSRPNQAGSDGNGPDPDQEDPPPEAPDGNETVHPDNPLLDRLLRRIALHLSRTLRGTGTTRGGGAFYGGGGDSGGVRGRRRAAISGGVAIAGAYGLRSGTADSVNDAGLSLADLIDLSPFEQARRIVDAASDRSTLIEEAELREVNANFVYWAIQQETPPSPIELVKQWVTEFVFRVWLTEAGERLRDGSRDGASTHTLEQEARVTLEARVSGVELPVDGIRASYFETAIQALLGMLSRIFR